ncbi:hypothetical protein Dsin_031237 [Dipteronia sinensis]|uniref:Non-specific lipid-transfer protein n=1 Tax=Dipteronia sinensis TaxID=43782 RepID=A0AAD9ZKN0_9ROSI|nr:hypothetical protein Dsin_031237 [Dipteronia sinensis]
MNLTSREVLAVMVVAVAAALFMVEPSEAISCGEVNSLLSPCLSYVGGSEGRPSESCCNNVRDLKNRAPSTGDKRVVCQCIKDQAWRFQDPASITRKASQIPGFCNVRDVSVPNDPNFDCNRIQ